MTFTFSRRFYPKGLTRMYTHFTFTLMAHCTSGAIRGSGSCSTTRREGIELAAFCLLNDFSTSCTTVSPQHTHTRRHTHTTRFLCDYPPIWPHSTTHSRIRVCMRSPTSLDTHTHTHTHTHPGVSVLPPLYGHTHTHTHMRT